MASINGYKTPTCATCKVAEKVATASGVTINWIDVSEDESTLLTLKSKLGKGPTDMIQVPLFDKGDDGKLYNITELRELLDAVTV